MVSKEEFTSKEIQEIEELHQKYNDLKEKFEKGEITVRQFKYRLNRINKQNEELKMFHDLRLGIESLVYAYKVGAISTKDYLNWKNKYLDFMNKAERSKR